MEEGTTTPRPDMEVPVPLTTNLAVCDRITAQFSMHHQTCEVDDTVSVDAVWSFLCIKGSDEPFKRRVKLTPGKAVFLDRIGCHLEDWSFVVIKNISVLVGQVQPTKEEREAFEKQIVQVMLGGHPLTEILPGEAFPLRLKSSLSEVMLGCLVPMSVLVYVFPPSVIRG